MYRHLLGPKSPLGHAALLGTPLDRQFMPGSDPTSWANMLKEDYAPMYRNELIEDNPIQSFMAEEIADESWTGKEKYVPVKVGRNWSTGSIGSRGALPQAGRSAWDKYLIGMRDVYTRVDFDRYVMEQSRNKRGSWAYVVPEEMEGAYQDLCFSRNRMGWGYGSGILALVNGAVTNSTAVTVDAPGNIAGSVLGNRFLHGDANGGMFVAFVDSGGTIQATATIVAVNANGTAITLDTAITCDDNAKIVLAQTPTASSLNREPEGLLAGIDDGTFVGTYHNLSRTTYPSIASYVASSVGAISADAIQQCIDAVAIRMGGKSKIDLLLCELAVRRAILAMMELDRRYTGGDLMRPDAGTVAAKSPLKRNITFGDIPIFADRDGQFGSLFGVNKESWVRYVLEKGKWANEDGSDLRWVSGYDVWTAFFLILENYHCHYPGRNFRMDGITVNQIVVRSF